MRDTRFLEVSECLGRSVWTGRTSGGYGNGPYRKTVRVGDERPLDKVLDTFGGSDVIERWLPTVCQDIQSWHDLNALVPDGAVSDREFTSLREQVMDSLEMTFPEHPWFWK